MFDMLLEIYRKEAKNARIYQSPSLLNNAAPDCYFSQSFGCGSVLAVACATPL
ncbi:MAG: hypothetical protein FWE67_11750 [Planctomycetaceae bacterium]|nr:hypothetical protein [Planctomycetaceae bacterium]